MADSTVPNVVFVFGDNVGWGQQSMTRHRNITPGGEFTGYFR